jgi:hypothetical protein
MVGAGTYADPKRPMFAPAAGKVEGRQGLLAFSYQVSDDGQLALVEFVAADPSVLESIRSNPSTVKSFTRGKEKKADIEAEFKKYKKDFDLDKLAVGAK